MVSYDKEGLKERAAEAAEVFEENKEFIKNFIAVHLNREYRHLVDDIYQESLLSIFKRPLPADAVNMRSYLFRVLLNDTFDAIRKETAIRKREGKYIRNKGHKDPWENGDKEVLKMEQDEFLEKFIEDNVCGCHRAAVRLRYIQGYDTGETAELMGVKKNTISRYVCLGMRKLKANKERLREVYYE